MRALISGRAMLAALAAASAFASAAAETAPSPATVDNPFSPAYEHPYRHGVVPTLEVHEQMRAWAAQNRAADAITGPQTLSFNGGVHGIGVTSGPQKVYLVFYGSQWGTASTDGNGNTTFSNDPSNAAPYLQMLYKGLGTGNELWSGTMTQYCDGPNVTRGATSCPSNAAFVAYPTGGALAGVWYDNSAPSPTQATSAQLAQEAANAAAHFGNTTAASNRYAQYVILSPTGTHPDGFGTSSGGFCAWHFYTSSSTAGDMAYHNMPYVSDLGSSCGANMVRDIRDGFSIVDGHEYAETITDQNPSGGWVNRTGSNYNGQENADECAWIRTGQGATALVTLGNGSYPMQSSWSNDTNRCDLTHPIVGGGGGTGPVANFSVSTSGLTATFTDLSTDSSGTITAYAWNFGDGGTSATANPTHAYAAAGTYTVTETVTDSNNQTSTWSAAVNVALPSSQLIANPGFESGSATPWAMTTGVLCSISGCRGEAPHAGSWFAWLNGYGSSHTDTLAQTVSIPAGKTSATLAFWLHIDTSETTTTTAFDKLTVQVLNSAGTVLQTLATYTNLNAASGYAQKTFNLGAYIGQTVTIKFTGTEDSSLETSFVIDDVTLTVQ